MHTFQTFIPLRVNSPLWYTRTRYTRGRTSFLSYLPSYKYPLLLSLLCIPGVQCGQEFTEF